MAVISAIVAVPLLISVWLLVRAQNVQPVTNPTPSGNAAVETSENAQPAVTSAERSQTQSTRPDVLPRRLPMPAAAPGTYAAKERSVAEPRPDALEPLSIRKPEPRPLATAPIPDPPAPPQPTVARGKSPGLLATLVAAIPHRVDPPDPPPVARYEPPRLLRRTPPTYPYIARQTGIQGEVVLIADIGQDGHVTAVRTMKGNPHLARAAADAVRTWKYDPATQDGKPVGSATEVRVRFSLHDN